MKKIVTSLLVLALLLCTTGLVACGGKDGGSTQTSKTTSAASTKTTTSSSSGGLTWNDIPMYSGASQIQKGTWSIPSTEEDEYSNFEWRYYETNAGIETVSAFYKSQMPGKGWTEAGWFETPQVHWGVFNKNNEKDAAMIWLSSDEGKTVIALWRATK